MKYFAGIDLGGTAAKVGLVNPDGEILKQVSVGIDNRDRFINIVTSIADMLAVMIRDTPGELTAIGIGAPGFVEEKTGVLLSGSENIPAMKGNSMPVHLNEKFGVPVFADNDATCAAAGELKFGIGVNYRSFVLITLGTGIGGGLVMDGRVYRGSRGFAGEIGHISLNANGIWCNCGTRGCFEQYASAPAIKRNYLEKCRKRGLKINDTVTAKEIFARAVEGDVFAEDAVDEAARAVARVFGILINLLNPEAFIIGGGVSRAGDLILNPVRRYLDDFAWPLLRRGVEVHIAALQNDAGLLGAAAQAMERSSPTHGVG